MSERRRWCWYFLGLTVVGYLLYLPVLRAWFVGDDLEEIWGGHTGGATATQNTHGARNFRPLNLWLHDLHYRVWGLNPFGFHLTSVALHVIAALLVAIATQVLATTPRDAGDIGPSAAHADETTTTPRVLPFLAGAIFLVMPTHTEAVSWISTRGDILMTCFLLISMICWLRPSATRYANAIGLLAFGLALVSKEPTVIFPFILSLLEVMRITPAQRSRRTIARAITRPWPHFVVLGGYLLARRFAFGTIKTGSFRSEFIGDSILGLVRRAGALLVRTSMPGMSVRWWAITLGIALLALAGIAIARAQGSSGGLPVMDRPWQVRFLLVAPLIALLPVARLGASATNTGGERLTYFPSVFVAILASWWLTGFIDRNRRVGVITTALVVGIAAASLLTINFQWRAAGDMARSITRQMGQLPRDQRVYLLGTPDSLGGPYVLRNAVESTLEVVHGWSEPGEAVQVSTIRYASPMDRVTVRPGSRPNSWRVRLEHPGAEFVQVANQSSAWTIESVDVTRIGQRELEVRFPPDVGPQQLWYFSEGRLRHVTSTTEG